MVRTYGLTHVALAVRDVRRAARFYRSVVGAIPVYTQKDFVQLQTPGTRDVIVVEQNTKRAGRPGGVVHFGFRLTRAADIGAALSSVKRAGGTILSHGEFVPGEPYLFARDPDGHEFEIWYELPTPVDPPARARRTPSRRRRAA
jgi:catechol 2,3-dioxygenase-like lactoylglutathione lyase family enzyme